MRTLGPPREGLALETIVIDLRPFWSREPGQALDKAPGARAEDHVDSSRIHSRLPKTG